MAVQTRSEQFCFGGRMGFYAHTSDATGTEMRFAVFLPPAALRGTRCPALFYPAGLECNEEAFVTKAGAQRVVAELDLVLVAPDTNPRGAGPPGEDTDWDFGTGAGFYLDAIAPPWLGPILVDQGTGDPFLETQLRPEALEAAAAASSQRLTLRQHEGYDHSYWFIQTVIADHLAWHARELGT